jgi:hypothetical protein
MQDTSAANAVVIDLTGHNLKVYSSDGTTNYANISATNTDATFQSNTGTTKIGNGTGAITLSAGASSAVTITGHATSTWSLDSGNLTIDVTSGSTPSLSLGTGAQTKTVTVGSTTSSSTSTIQSGSGGISLSGNTTVSGSNTFTTGTGAVSLNGVSTVANGKTLVLGSNSGTGGLTCTNGAMFYDSSANRFKGCESSAWITLDNYADLQTYTASGSWTKPANVTAVQVILVGGGGASNGGGGSGCSGGNGGQPGGGGGGGGSSAATSGNGGTGAAGEVWVISW